MGLWGSNKLLFANVVEKKTGWPNLTIGDPNGRPVITQTHPTPVMTYSDSRGVVSSVELKALPAPNTKFGVDATTGQNNGGAFYNPRGWVEIQKANTLVDGYNFNHVTIGPVQVSNTTIARCWFHNIDGQDSWAVWCHDEGPLEGLTIRDCRVEGTSASVTGPTGMLMMDGRITKVILTRCSAVNTSSFVQFTGIFGAGTAPYVNQITENYMGFISDPSHLGLHLENVNISAGTGGLLIERNTIVGPVGQTAGVYICHDAGDVGNITTNDNVFDGAPQIVTYQGSTGKRGGVLISKPGNMKFTNNKLKVGNAGFGSLGIVTRPHPRDPRLIATGNRTYPAFAPIPGIY